jgi:NADH:ubiquinone oxidoreductase subunit F (NADH-binding)
MDLERRERTDSAPIVAIYSLAELVVLRFSRLARFFVRNRRVPALEHPRDRYLLHFGAGERVVANCHATRTRRWSNRPFALEERCSRIAHFEQRLASFRAASRAQGRAVVVSDAGLPRLLRAAGERPLTWSQHLEAFGPMPSVSALSDLLGAAGLRGRGGASFPTQLKVQLVGTDRARRKYVVVNAMEGEPAAHKDQSLIGIHPHLVLDGALALARSVGAKDVAVCVARENSTTVNYMERALHERENLDLQGIRLELHTPPGRYIAGEESALVHWLDDNETLPQFRNSRPAILRIGRGSVLVDNAETHANVALIARRGAAWFRSLGTENHPGTVLVSVSGAVPRATVIEVALGTPLREILASVGAVTNPRALLLGGYGGSWIDGDDIDTRYDNDSLAPLQASVGAGVMVVLPQESCGVAETYNISRWMANESARQCGPCAFGLPAMSDSLAQLSSAMRQPAIALEQLRDRAVVINGRGACRHPDGVVRMIQSALRIFHEDVSHHAQGRACSYAQSSHFATVPRLELEQELEWE